MQIKTTQQFKKRLENEIQEKYNKMNNARRSIKKVMFVPIKGNHKKDYESKNTSDILESEEHSSSENESIIAWLKSTS